MTGATIRSGLSYTGPTGTSPRRTATWSNNYFYWWEHRHIYDFESLAVLLRRAGFAAVVEARFGHSEHALLRGIDRHDPEGLDETILCVDAVKPS